VCVSCIPSWTKSGLYVRIWAAFSMHCAFFFFILGHPRARNVLHRFPSICLSLGHLIPGIVFTVVACSIQWPSEVAQHRAVLEVIAITSVFAVGLNSLTGVFLCLMPASAFKWIKFCMSTESKTTADVFLACATFSAAVFLYAVFERQYRRHFASLQAAKLQVKTCENVEHAVRVLIETLFNASCFCNDQGAILSSTGALDQLLNGGNPLMQASEPTLLAFVDNGKRLLQFLANANHSPQIPSPIPVTLHCNSAPSVPKSTIEATLFCMRLPDMPHFFVGVKLASSDEGHTLGDTALMPSYLKCGIDQEHSQARNKRTVESQCAYCLIVLLLKIILMVFRGGRGCVAPDSFDHVGLCVTAVACVCVSYTCRRETRKHITEVHRENLSLNTHEMLQGPDVASIAKDSESRDECCCIGTESTKEGDQRLHDRVGRGLLTIAILFSYHALQASLTRLCLGIADVLLQHRAFVTLHILLSCCLSPLMELPTHMHLLGVFPITIYWWLEFHRRVGYFAEAVQLFGFLPPLLSFLWFKFGKKLTAGIDEALAKEQYTHSMLSNRYATYQRMLEAIFDASCACDPVHGVLCAQTSSPQFDHLFPNMRGSPVSVLGADIDDRLKLIRLVHDAVAAEGRCAAVANICVVLFGLGDGVCCKAKIFAVAQGIQPAWSSSVLIGLQLSSYDGIGDIVMHGVTIDPIRIFEESVQPSDSITSIGFKDQVHVKKVRRQKQCRKEGRRTARSDSGSTPVSTPS
jgi:hypothetical protein